MLKKAELRNIGLLYHMVVDDYTWKNLDKYAYPIKTSFGYYPFDTPLKLLFDYSWQLLSDKRTSEEYEKFKQAVASMELDIVTGREEPNILAAVLTGMIRFKQEAFDNQKSIVDMKDLPRDKMLAIHVTAKLFNLEPPDEDSIVVFTNPPMPVVVHKGEGMRVVYKPGGTYTTKGDKVDVLG